MQSIIVLCNIFLTSFISAMSNRVRRLLAHIQSLDSLLDLITVLYSTFILLYFLYSRYTRLFTFIYFLSLFVDIRLFRAFDSVSAFTLCIQDFICNFLQLKILVIKNNIFQPRLVTTKVLYFDDINW